MQRAVNYSLVGLLLSKGVRLFYPLQKTHAFVHIHVCYYVLPFVLNQIIRKEYYEMPSQNFYHFNFCFSHCYLLSCTNYIIFLVNLCSHFEPFKSVNKQLPNRQQLTTVYCGVNLFSASNSATNATSYMVAY